MPGRRLLLGSLCVFVVLAIGAAVRAADWSYGADTGTFVQVILDAAGPMWNGVERTTHYRFHWSPTLIVLWPALALTHSRWVLQAILAAATVACAPLLAAVARGGGLGQRAAVPEVADRIGAVALLYPPLFAVGFGEFRDLGLFAPLALGWWLALQRRAWGALAGAALLLAGLREDVCLEIALIGIGVGIAFAVRRERARAIAAFATAALCLASDAVYALAVIPRVGPWPPSHFYVYPFATGPLQLALAPFTHPLAFAAAMLVVGRLTYLLEAFAPLAFLPLRSPLVLTALPGLAIVLLANSYLVWRMGEHYAALWIPWLLLAFAAAIVRLRRAVRWTSVALTLCGLVLIVSNPAHPFFYLRPSYHALGDARAALACVPAGASVATHDEWYTAIAGGNPRAMVLGDDPPPADWLVVADDYPNAHFAAAVLPLVRERVARGAYRRACRFGAVAAYRRAS